VRRTKARSGWLRTPRLPQSSDTSEAYVSTDRKTMLLTLTVTTLRCLRQSDSSPSHPHHWSRTRCDVNATDLYATVPTLALRCSNLTVTYTLTPTTSPSLPRPARLPLYSRTKKSKNLVCSICESHPNESTTLSSAVHPRARFTRCTAVAHEDGVVQRCLHHSESLESDLPRCSQLT